MVIYGQDERLLPWALERIGIGQFREDAKAIGLERNGELVAVCAYDTFSPRDCQMHIASDGTGRWLTREFLVRSFAYPFIQCDLPRVTGIVAAKNRAALKFDHHLGFRTEGYCPLALPDDDAVILGLLRRECRFIPLENRHD